MNPAIIPLPKFDYSPYTKKWRPAKRGVESLSDRERAVVCLIASSYSTREIAKMLGVADKTIRTHRFRAFQKLGITNPVRLTHFAFSRGMIKNIYASEPNG